MGGSMWEGWLLDQEEQQGGREREEENEVGPFLLPSALAPVSERVVPCLDDDVLNGIIMR